MKYYIKTYGCQMNHSDSERIASVLDSAGYKKISQENEADLIVINMCSVRKSAVDRIAGNFKKYKKYKKKNPKLKIVLTGCVLENDKKRFEKMFDLVIDIKEIKELNRCLNNHEAPLSQDTQKDSTISLQRKQFNQHFDYFHINPKYQNKIAAYVPIMTGCNNFCSYCVVPHTRGREKSRPVEEIINEISNLVKNGYKEIILLGQNVNSYKSQIQNHKLQTNSKFKIQNSKHILCSVFHILDSEEINFSTLLKLINNIPGDFWIRFLTSHPKDMTEELIKTVAECEKVTPYIHLALQSGDNEILKKMNRKYTAKHFLNLIKIIRKYIQDVAITTDVIVGFPTETEKQFQNTAEVMKKAKFDMVYINKYSPREGTMAAKLKDNVGWQEKKRREKILTEILKKTALENNKKYIGKIVDVLIEKIDDNYIYGKTRSFKNVKVIAGFIVSAETRNRNANIDEKRLNVDKVTKEPTNIKAGKFIKIKITQADAWGLEGKVVK